jgi:NAD+ kinase
MIIAVYGKTFNERSAQVVYSLSGILTEAGVDVVMYEPLHDFLRSTPETFDHIKGTFRGYEDLPSDTRFLMSVGGDGTFLGSGMIVRDSGIPIVGINIGRLGFMANVTELDLKESVGKLLAGELAIEERTLLRLEAKGNLFGDFPYALNDAVIQKNTTGLIIIHTWSNDEFLNSYWADGLIVATPTGSTAYSLSVGGPVMAPESQNFIISPMAPHNLNVRPLVIPDSVVLRLSADCRAGGFTLSLDSRSAECACGTEITLQRADFKIKVVKSTSFYATLRHKLMWGADKRN